MKKFDWKFEHQIEKQNNLILQLQNQRYKQNLNKIKIEQKKLKQLYRDKNYYYCC